MSQTISQEFTTSDCNENNLYDTKCNKLLLKKELLERQELEKQDNEQSDALYPDINDPNFIVKIAEKKEFNDTQYDGSQKDIETFADESKKGDFELAPHQIFVKNYLSFQTPYNSLLLYHQLGTGKTCSAIGVCEEMRDYLRESGITKRILIIASPNVQDNFRLQLFDERKLTEENGLWQAGGCIGNKFIKEINPTSIKNIPKEKIISQINSLINKSYLFMGYDSFSNYIRRVSLEDNANVSEKQIIKNLQYEFSNRLLVIDEVHNIRIAQENTNKKVATQLLKLVMHVDNMRLLLLSATPMYNSAKEIIWLLNLMNVNDRRGQIDMKDVFDKKGQLKEGGKELLIRKATGYISYVRGENPYTFPFRVYPNIFAPNKTFEDNPLPIYQMNGKRIKDNDGITIFNDKLFVSKIGSYQKYVYRLMIDKMQSSEEDRENIDQITTFKNMDGFKYTLLQSPLESLVMTYPMNGVKEIADELPPFEKENVEETDNEEIVKKDPEHEYSSVSTGNEDDEVDKFILKPEYADPKSTDLKEFDIENLEVNDDDNELEMRINTDTDIDSEEEDYLDDDSEDEEYEEKKPPIKIGEEVSIDITEKPSSEESIVYEGGENATTSDNKPTTGYIDINALTGKKGLARLMDFDDSVTPPLKGNFSYKTDSYGNIFSPKEIGKYSHKIKNICDEIMKSKGIILIYSQWIDAGLIPMALALEELGFVKSNNTTLFKNAPTEPIDSLSLKPKGSGNKSFKSAKYAMITGDVRLSPNNNEEIKKITDDANKYGENVKVVLISKAASEGIDLKCIRQVHILEPWYTLSRIEQIIGRAVRSFSHILLPFKERNVQIFLHSTKLDDEQEESTDMYVYRIAEQKAKQIGEISRILKETSVDCLLNTEQNNFNQANMNTQVEQVLSNGKTIKKFKVGDIPYSAMCDYMGDCTIKCSPDAKIDKDSINDTTYDENFIKMNAEKIMAKIRMLMKEEFFYKKNVLLTKINHPKTYPLTEIYSALTQLIDDATEVITDKFGRSGRLVNIGEYYFFRPNELTSKNTDSFHLKTPIDHKNLSFVLKKEGREENIEPEIVVGEVKTKEIDEDVDISKDTNIDDGKKIVERIEDQYSLAMQYTKEKAVERGDKSGDNKFYKHLGVSLKKIEDTLDVSIDKMKKYIIYHSVDVLPYHKKLTLLNYVTNEKTMDEDKDFVKYTIKMYFDFFIITDKALTSIIFYENNERHILILNKNTNTWVDAEEEDKRDLSNAIRSRYTIPSSALNNLIGSISQGTKDDELVFKTKDRTNKRNTGTRCDQAGKSNNILILNKILGKDTFTKENIKPIVEIGVCCIQEMILRYYNEEKPDTIWFLSPDTAKMLNL